MSNHKLGWQTSDQQNKTVSSEGGFYSSGDGLGVQPAFLNKLFLKKMEGNKKPIMKFTEKKKKMR